MKEEDFAIKDTITKGTLHSLKAHIEQKPLYRVFIDTDGGDLRAAIAMIGLIKEKIEFEPTIIANGRVYSAGAFFFLSFKNRVIIKNSSMLIHDVGLNTTKLTEEIKAERKRYRRVLQLLVSRNFRITEIEADRLIRRGEVFPDFIMAKKLKIPMVEYRGRLDNTT